MNYWDWLGKHLLFYESTSYCAQGMELEHFIFITDHPSHIIHN